MCFFIFIFILFCQNGLNIGPTGLGMPRALPDTFGSFLVKICPARNVDCWLKCLRAKVDLIWRIRQIRMRQHARILIICLSCFTQTWPEHTTLTLTTVFLKKITFPFGAFPESIPHNHKHTPQPYTNAPPNPTPMHPPHEPDNPRVVNMLGGRSPPKPP